MQESAGEVISTREAAERLGVSLRTVQLWSEAGILRAWKTPGGHRRILVKSVDEVLRQRGAALAAPGDGRLRVLVVEDEPDFRRLFELHLKSWDLPVDLHCVPGGFDALLHIGAVRPDVLVTDLRMPGIDGFEMIRALVASESVGDMVILVVTALTRHTIEERGGLPDSIPVLQKPLRFDDLRQRLVAILADRAAAAPTGS